VFAEEQAFLFCSKESSALAKKYFCRSRHDESFSRAEKPEQHFMNAVKRILSHISCCIKCLQTVPGANLLD